jgi:transposase
MKREDLIRKIVVLRIQGYIDKEIIEDTGIPRRTYFYWKKRIAEQGIHRVIVKQKPGPEPKKLIDPFIRKNALKWRDRYGWGPGKVSGHLKVHHNTHISHHQIYRLFVATKRNNPLRYTRKIKGKKRYERKHSMTLLHTDWKDIATEPMLTYQDDHSRFILKSRKFQEATMENSIRLLEQVIRSFGKPKQVLTDRGSQFWNNRSDKPTEFTRFCTDNEILHIKCSKASPQANGKLENFHGQYDKESWRFKTHGRYIRHWNYERPHGGIGYLYPYEVFVRDGAINSG